MPERRRGAGGLMSRGIDRTRAGLWSVPVGLQLSALYTLVLVATLALLGSVLYIQLDGFLVQDTAARLERARQPFLARQEASSDPFRTDARGFGPPSAFTRSGNPDRVPGFLVRGLTGPDVTVAVLDTQGQVLTSTLAYEGGAPRPLPALPAGWLTGLGNTGAKQWVLPDPAGGRQLVVLQTLTIPGTADTAPLPLLLEQAASLAAADAVLNQVRLYLVLGILAGTILGVGAGLALTRLVLRPLDRMARTAEAIAGGDLARRLRLPGGHNEIARTGHAFDHMVDRLAAALEAQRRFIADASHELRTPLTSLEGLSEMLLIGADRGDSRAVQRTVRSMHSELGRLSRLVADLLTLSRLDGAAPLHLGPVDAGRLIAEVAAQMAPLAAGQGVALQSEALGPVLVQAEPDKLKQVLLNLVDNAVRYTPAGGKVRLVATGDPATATGRLQVLDTGPGIDPADLPHLFERFYRGDPSRSRTTGNSGLGLAIARTIVQAHGGTITAQTPAGGGAVFTVVLPAARTGEAQAPDPPPPALSPRRARASEEQAR